VFDYFCSTGHLELAKWLLQIKPDIYIRGGFFRACMDGQLEVAKWLLNVKPDINFEDYVFLCAHNSEIAKLLLQVKPDIISIISTQNEMMFRKACSYNRIELAKWLLQMKPDINISACDDYAFRNACRNSGHYNAYLIKHLEVAKWLQSLKPYLYVIEYDENGNYANYRIRSKEEANWEKRKCALHLAYQENTNILYHLPVDIVKAVTQFI